MAENINISPKSKGVESMNLSDSDSDVEAGHETMTMNYEGTTSPLIEMLFFHVFIYDELLSIITKSRRQFVDMVIPARWLIVLVSRPWHYWIKKLCLEHYSKVFHGWSTEIG